MSFPISIRILGEYEDVYLYKDVLYMWTYENDLQLVNWPQLIASIAESSDPLILRWSFSRNDALRSYQFKDMLGDAELRETLSRKLLRVDEQRIVLEPSDIRPFVITTIPNGVNHVTDVLLYRDVLYMSALSGVYGRRAESISGGTYFDRVERISDLYTVAISAKYRTITGSCCEDGLFCWSSMDRIQRPSQVYHADRFTRSISWLYCDLVSLEEDSFGYHVNLRPQDSKRGKTYGRATVRGDGDSRLADEGIIDQYGVAVLDERSLIKDTEAHSMPRTVFTWQNSIFVCGRTNDHFRLVKWTKPRGEEIFHAEGLHYKTAYKDVHADVFWGGAIDARTAVLDTDRGTLIYTDTGEPYVLSDDINVNVRVFSDSKWYVNLVCSVKEDHVLFSCIWPFDPVGILSEQYYDGRLDRWKPWSSPYK